MLVIILPAIVEYLLLLYADYCSSLTNPGREEALQSRISPLDVAVSPLKSPNFTHETY